MKDLICAALLGFLAAVYYFGTLGFQRSVLDDAVGIAGFPRALAAVLTGISILIALSGLIKIAQQRTAAAGGGTAGDGEGERKLREHLGAAFVVLVGASYSFLAPAIGYVPALALLIAVTAAFSGAEKSWTTPAVALGLAVAFYLFFVALLGTDQPLGRIDWRRLASGLSS